MPRIKNLLTVRCNKPGSRGGARGRGEGTNMEKGWTGECGGGKGRVSGVGTEWRWKGECDGDDGGVHGREG